MICRCKPKAHYLRKYASPKQVVALDMDRIRNFGRQILETLKYMNDKGFPYGKKTKIKEIKQVKQNYKSDTYMW
jgi:hypothetical protein